MPDTREDILTERRVPEGVPLLESWWWRALLAGTTIGLVPLLIVLWHFIDEPFGAWMERSWPGFLTGFGIVGAPEPWLTASGIAFLWMAAQRGRQAAQQAFSAFVTVGVAVLACGLCDAFARGALLLSGCGPEWSHLSPSTRCATIAAAAMWAWSGVPSWRRRLSLAVPLVMSAEVAMGVAFAADAVAGAWIGAVSGLVVPWIRWRGRQGWTPRGQWTIGYAQPAGDATRP